MASSEIDLKFPTPIPVNITYQTAFVDDAGKLQLRKDVYGRDAAMLSLLKNGRNKDLETVVAHSQPSYSRPPSSSLPAGVNFASDNGSLRPILLRAAVRRTADAACAGRPAAAAAGIYPVIYRRGPMLNFQEKSTISSSRTGSFKLTIIHPDFGRARFSPQSTA